MNEIKFKKWLLETKNNPKIACDAIYRLRRIENELKKMDLDIEYKKDKCASLLALFANRGRNKDMLAYQTNLPIGKAYMATYVYAIKQYIQFCDVSK